MANEEHLAILKQGVEVWNDWRRRSPDKKPDLSEADLHGRRDLHGVNLRGVNLEKAILSGATLVVANLRWANLRGAKLDGADLNEADLRHADLTGAHLIGTDLRDANLTSTNLMQADFLRADLSGADLNGADLSGANLSDCRIYGISAWNMNLKDTIQTNLIITRKEETEIRMDDVEVAQFIYLLLNNQKLKNVIDTLTSKAVLILGRFTDERKKILESIRDELRHRGYLPIVFDFVPSASRDLTETVTLLARMARFIIADISDPKSIPQELTAIIPDLPSAPVQPIILASQREYAMYEHWRRYPWVLEMQTYNSTEDLVAELTSKVIAPAEKYLEQSRSEKKSSG